MKEKTTAPVAMDDGVESQSVFPGGGEILDADTRVLGRGALGPSQKSFTGRQWFILAHHDIRYLKEEKTKYLIQLNERKTKRNNNNNNKKCENNKHVVKKIFWKIVKQ